MTVTYRTGYGTTRRTLEELNTWPRFGLLHPEFRARLIALMNEGFRYGKDIGIGGGFRYESEQLSLALDRHYQVASGGCCGYNGKRYALKSGMAHAAFPGNSYHEAVPGLRFLRTDGTYMVTNDRGVAVDTVGHDAWMQDNLARFGLRSFANLSGAAKEEWHVQPIELPTSRANFNPTIHVLKKFALPAPTQPQPDYPKPTLTVGSTGGEVIELQQHCNFWGWYAYAIDGSFGPRTAEAVKKMQAVLRITQDGVYGTSTANAYLKYLTALQSLA